jgi:hypothetical protein
MCWNKDISLNTFLFACFALVFIYITNTYTRYKTPTFDNPLVYLLVFFVSSMQLLEYFIWKNLNNKPMNTFLSKLGLLLIFLQIFSIILLIDNEKYKYVLLFCFLLFSFTSYVYKSLYSPFVFKTIISKNGHLSWEWLRFDGIEKIILLVGLLFYLISALLIKSVSLSNVYIGGLFFLLSYLFLKKDNTYGSMWCWLINLLLLKSLIDILIIQPFYEYNGLC